MELYPGDTLLCAEIKLSGIASVPENNLIVVSTESESVYIHKCSTGRFQEPIRIFSGHSESVGAVLHLSDDILASVDDAGMLLNRR